MSGIYEAFKQSDETKLNRVVQMLDQVNPVPDSPAEEPESERVTRAREASIEAAAPPQARSAYRTAPVRILGHPLFPFDGTDPRAAEQYRVLRTNILQHPLQPRVIAISSPTAGDGKTVTAINIAGSFALKAGARVLIVDADLRRCGMADALNIDAHPGLPDVLQGRCRLEDAILQIEQLPSLHVLPSKQASVNPAELLDSPRWTGLLAELRQRFSIVILDTNPVAAVADFKLVQHVCDGVLMIVRPDHTGRTELFRALEIEKKKKLLGVVINAFDDWFMWNAPGECAYDKSYAEPKTRAAAGSSS